MFLLGSESCMIFWSFYYLCSLSSCLWVSLELMWLNTHSHRHSNKCFYAPPNVLVHHIWHFDITDHKSRFESLSFSASLLSLDSLVSYWRSQSSVEEVILPNQRRRVRVWGQQPFSGVLMCQGRSGNGGGPPCLPLEGLKLLGKEGERELSRAAPSCWLAAFFAFQVTRVWRYVSIHFLFALMFGMNFWNVCNKELEGCLRK